MAAVNDGAPAPRPMTRQSLRGVVPPGHGFDPGPPSMEVLPPAAQSQRKCCIAKCKEKFASYEAFCAHWTISHRGSIPSLSEFEKGKRDKPRDAMAESAVTPTDEGDEIDLQEEAEVNELCFLLGCGSSDFIRQQNELQRQEIDEFHQDLVSLYSDREPKSPEFGNAIKSPREESKHVDQAPLVPLMAQAGAAPPNVVPTLSRPQPLRFSTSPTDTFQVAAMQLVSGVQKGTPAARPRLDKPKHAEDKSNRGERIAPENLGGVDVSPESSRSGKSAEEDASSSISEVPASFVDPPPSVPAGLPRSAIHPPNTVAREAHRALENGNDGWTRIGRPTSASVGVAPQRRGTGANPQSSTPSVLLANAFAALGTDDEDNVEAPEQPRPQTVGPTSPCDSGSNGGGSDGSPVQDVQSTKARQLILDVRGKKSRRDYAEANWPTHTCRIPDCECGGRVFKAAGQVSAAMALVLHFIQQFTEGKIQLPMFKKCMLLGNNGNIVQCPTCHQFFGTKTYFSKHVAGTVSPAWNPCRQTQVLRTQQFVMNLVDGRTSTLPTNPEPQPPAPTSRPPNEEAAQSAEETFSGRFVLRPGLLTPYLNEPVPRGLRRLTYFPQGATSRLAGKAMQVGINKLLGAEGPGAKHQAFLDFMNNVSTMSTVGARRTSRYLRNKVPELIQDHAFEWINGAAELSKLSYADAAPADEATTEQTKKERQLEKQIFESVQLMRRGYNGRAMKCLMRSFEPRSELTPAKLEKISKKFIQDGTLDQIYELPEGTAFFICERDEIREVIKHFANGKAAAASGHASDHYKALVNNEEGTALLAELFMSILNDDFTGRGGWAVETLEALMTSNLFWWDKPDSQDDVRIISNPEPLWQMLCMVALAKIPEETRLKSVMEYQLAVNKRAGCEIAFWVRDIIHTVTMACAYPEINMERYTSMVIGWDVQDMYYKFDRNFVLRCLFENRELEPLFRPAQLMCSMANRQTIRLPDGRVHTFRQTGGFGAGNSLTGFLVANALSVCIKHTHTIHKQVLIRAVMDDGFTYGQPEETCNAVELLQQTLQERAGSNLKAEKMVCMPAHPIFHAATAQKDLEPEIMFQFWPIEEDEGRQKQIEELVEWWKTPNNNADSDSAEGYGHDVRQILNDLKIPVVDITKFVGGHIAHNQNKVREECERKFGATSKKFKATAQALKVFGIKYPLAALQLMRSVMMFGNVYFMRIYRPSVIEPIVTTLHAKMIELALELTGVDKLERGMHRNHRAELAARRRLFELQAPTGLGIANLNQLSKCAWIGALAQAAPEVQTTMAFLTGLTPDQAMEKFPNSVAYQTEYDRTRQYFVELVPNIEEVKLAEGVPLVPTTFAQAISLFAAHPKLAHLVQRKLMELVHAANLQSVKEDPDLASNANQQLLASRIETQNNRNPGRWLHLATVAARLTYNLAHIAVQRYLGYNVAPKFYQRPKGPWKCLGCGEMVPADENAHFDACAKLKAAEGGQRSRNVVKAIYRAMERNSVYGSMEYHLPSGKRSDIHMALDGLAWHADVTVVCPQGETHANEKDPAQAANKGKLSKYLQEVMAEGEVFVPMAFTSSGGTPQVTDWLLKQIAEAGEAHECSNPIPIAEIRDAIAQEIAVGTAMINKAGIHRSYGFKIAVPAQRGTKRRAPVRPETPPPDDEREDDEAARQG